MGRRSKDAKKKRAKARRGSNWLSFWPYLAVLGLAAAVVAALFLVGGGGGGSGSPDRAASAYPTGYAPPTLGQASAPVELVMWEDFQCPFCRRFELGTVSDLRDRYVSTGKVKLVWRNFVHYGQESQDAATAAYCAGEQGRFWEYHDALFRTQRGINQGAFAGENLRVLAQRLNLDRTSFDSCLSNGSKYQRVLSADYDVARSQSIDGTPTFFVNGEMIVGAQPLNTFVDIIEAKLQQARPP